MSLAAEQRSRAPGLLCPQGRLGVGPGRYQPGVVQHLDPGHLGGLGQGAEIVQAWGRGLSARGRVMSSLATVRTAARTRYMLNYTCSACAHPGKPVSTARAAGRTCR